MLRTSARLSTRTPVAYVTGGLLPGWGRRRPPPYLPNQAQKLNKMIIVMQKWEYLVKGYWYDGKKKSWLAGGPGVDVAEYLNELGAQGWELVGVALEGVPAGGNIPRWQETPSALFFKRPLS